MPTASRPVIDTCRITLKRLIDDRKRGSTTANSAISTTRNSVGAKRATKPNTSTPPVGLGSAALVSVIARLKKPAREPSAAPSWEVIIDIRISWVASLRAISPVTRPSRMVTMRSETARISGSSDEMTMTAMPDLAISIRRLCTSTLEPTSMPRVGSSTIRIFGLSASQRASTTFC